MATTRTGPPRLKVGSTPFYCAGQPPHLFGDIELFNSGDAMMKVRSLPVVGLKLPDAAPVVAGALRLHARLQPGELARATVQFTVPANTRPGRYDAQFDHSGKRFPVIMHVLESWRLGIVPGKISLKVPYRDAPIVEIEVTNLGNMPCTLHPVSVVPLTLERTDGLRAAIQQALGTRNAVEPNAPAPRTSKDSENQSPFAEIKLEGGDTALQPGEMRRAQIQFRFPDSLEAQRLYFGSVELENARLRFDVEIIPTREADSSL